MTYMDDSIDSVVDEAKTETIQTELQEQWKNAGMEARKWVSNSKNFFFQLLFCVIGFGIIQLLYGFRVWMA